MPVPSPTGSLRRILYDYPDAVPTPTFAVFYPPPQPSTFPFRPSAPLPFANAPAESEIAEYQQLNNILNPFWESFPGEGEWASYYASAYTASHDHQKIQSAARDYYRSHLTELLEAIERKAAETAILDYGGSIPILLAEAVQMGFRQAHGVDYAPQSKEYGARG